MSRFSLSIFICGIFLLGTIGNVCAQERILNYHSDIRVNKDRTVLVEEHIKANVLGFVFKRGIYRDIPTSYDYKGGKYRIQFNLLSVKKNGQEEPYHEERMNNGIRVYVGDTDVYLDPGVYDYTLTYKVEHVLGMFDSFDELTWNVNGNGWDVSIDSMSATVYLPNQAPIIQTAVYTGAYGQTENEAKKNESIGEVQFIASKSLHANEGMTVSVGWKKGFISYPNAFEQLIFKLQTFALWIIALLGLFLTVLLNTLFWWRKGRDPKKGIIIPQFEAPSGLSPADCSYIDNYFTYKHNAFAATLVSLSVQKAMKIEDEIEKKNIFTNRQKYTFKKEDVFDTTKLVRLEQEFMKDLFGKKTEVEVIRKTFNANIVKARDELKAQLKINHEDKHITRNTALTLKSMIIPAISIVLGIICFSKYGGNVGIIVLLSAVLIAISYLFSRWYQQPTAEGRKLMDHVAGLKHYIKYTEEDKLKLVNPPNFTFEHFERMLPFAIALDCADEWQQQFEVINPQEASSAMAFPWYYGSNVHGYRDFDFSDINDTISSAAIPPSTSGSGGGSFSGGGGFSGGGFGGGGGGGW